MTVSPPKVDRIHRCSIGGLPDFLPKRSDVPSLEVVIEQATVEVAVVTNRLAEWDVEVETEGNHALV